MHLGLSGKVVATGGTKGIGFACALLFLAEGARAGVVSRSKSMSTRHAWHFRAPAESRPT
jgi:NAD(P)-dependent dehydrogenase (short-subunit alcohol dehydrogenase family)